MTQEPIAYINVEKRTLEFAEPIKWHTPTVVNLDRIPLFTKEALAQPEQEHCQCSECKVTLHASDCAVHSEPAFPKGECDCGAQPKQKPVAWKLPNKNVVFWEDTKEVDEYHGFEPTIPLYPHPQRKPLTDEEIDAIYTGVRAVHHEIDSYVFARAIEAAHGIKEKNNA